MPEKKVKKKVVPKKARASKRVVSTVTKKKKESTAKKTSTKKVSTTKKAKTVKKKPVKKTASKKSTTKKPVKKVSRKVSKKVSTKKKIATKTTTKRKSIKKNIQDLIQIEGAKDLELKIFETPLHFSNDNNTDIEPPKLFEEDILSEEKSDNVITNNHQATHHVVVKQSHQSKWSQNILDLSKISTEDKSEHMVHDADAFIISSTEDGFWKAVDTFMKGGVDVESSYEKAKAQNIYNFLNLSIVSWMIYIWRVAFVIFNPLVKFFSNLIKFVTKSVKGYAVTLFAIFKLLFSGRLNRDNFLNPDQAFVDVSLFEHSIQPRLQFAFNAVAVKSLVLFIVLSMVVVLPVKGMALIDGLQKEQTQVLGVSETAYSSLQLALDDMNQFAWLSASDNFQNSRTQFASIYQNFQNSNALTKKILKALPNTKQKIETAENLLQVGVEVSLLGEKVANLLNILQSDNEKVLITGKIRAVQAAIDEIQVIESRITNNFSYIDVDSLPEEMQSDVALLKDSLPKLFSSLNQVEELVDFAYILIGGDKQQRYVLVFQNSDELRATGGFMGSLTTATIYQGSIVEMDTPGGGPYDWQAWIKNPTQAPKPLWLVNPVWQFQDANWFADFPAAANKILEFYNETKSEKINGVIAINSYMLPAILQIVGDIELPEYDKVLTPDNVLYEIQNVVELEYDKEENKPKKIIGDLFSVIIDRLLASDSDKLIDILEVVNTGLLQRDIQMYFTDPELQAQAHKFQWSGELKQTSGDYLMIVNSNIGGAKTDKFMVQESKLNSFIQPDGSIINELTIRRTNNGIPGDVFYGLNNVDYIRIYVPEGSELIDASGDFEPPEEKFFEQPPQDIPVDDDYTKYVSIDGYDSSGVRISNQFGKTVFSGWLQTNLGETSEIKIRYKLPLFPITISTQSDSPIVRKLDTLLQVAGIKNQNEQKIWYSLYWQKQSGHNNHSIDYTLYFLDNWDLEHAVRPGFVTENKVEYQLQLEQDFSSGFLFGVE